MLSFWEYLRKQRYNIDFIGLSDSSMYNTRLGLCSYDSPLNLLIKRLYAEAFCEG
ncbi:hypothetical protein PORCRE_1599 [Porphyromonas crevioricanis JCM 15906]|uniref:Uncharacterized protein n=1 Tax=Porphyromonas crevioricanis JCM 15906 TaxID=1305617 RepID=T1DTL9_9PORP|nr:hypothetical protein PORCRE_1599 [Porphyromonas crevioricanis JCM 15906]GAD07961.1 hypothetical protein PORCAN_1590 [Porphyromonas crevioricanis JCM 13913]